MPIIKSAKKRMRVSEKKRVRNKSARSLCKSRIVKANKLISEGEQEAAEKAVLAVASSLDKAAEKGIVHRNNASRRKSRLVKKLNKVKAGGSN